MFHWSRLIFILLTMLTKKSTSETLFILTSSYFITICSPVHCLVNVSLITAICFDADAKIISKTPCLYYENQITESDFHNYTKRSLRSKVGMTSHHKSAQKVSAKMYATCSRCYIKRAVFFFFAEPWLGFQEGQMLMSCTAYCQIILGILFNYLIYLKKI